MLALCLNIGIYLFINYINIIANMTIVIYFMHYITYTNEWKRNSNILWLTLMNVMYQPTLTHMQRSHPLLWKGLKLTFPDYSKSWFKSTYLHAIFLSIFIQKSWRSYSYFLYMLKFLSFIYCVLSMLCWNEQGPANPMEQIGFTLNFVNKVLF